MNALYEVTISHARSAPLRNVFRYRGDYRMSLPEPGADPGGKLALSVRLDRPDGHSFAASVRGRAVPVTARARLKTAVRYPWSTAAVSARIRWQGVRLYLRGLPVIPRPAHQTQEGVQ